MQKEKTFKYSNNCNEKNEKYLFELQKFLDRAENIKDDELKRSIITQMLKCEKALIEIAKEILEKKYSK